MQLQVQHGTATTARQPSALTTHRSDLQVAKSISLSVTVPGHMPGKGAKSLRAFMTCDRIRTKINALFALD